MVEKNTHCHHIVRSSTYPYLLTLKKAQFPDQRTALCVLPSSENDLSQQTLSDLIADAFPEDEMTTLLKKRSKRTNGTVVSTRERRDEVNDIVYLVPHEFAAMSLWHAESCPQKCSPAGRKTLQMLTWNGHWRGSQWTTSSGTGASPRPKDSWSLNEPSMAAPWRQSALSNRPTRATMRLRTFCAASATTCKRWSDPMVSTDDRALFRAMSQREFDQCNSIGQLIPDLDLEMHRNATYGKFLVWAKRILTPLVTMTPIGSKIVKK